MPYLRILGHVENIWPLAVSLYRERATLRSVEGLPGVRRAVIIDGSYERAGLEKWTTLRNTITAARRIIGAQFDLTGAVLEQLDAGAHIPWEKGTADIMVHVGIIPHPMAMIFAGNEGASVQFGQVVVVDGKAMCSATNSGAGPRIHLVLSLRQRVIEEEPT